MKVNKLAYLLLLGWMISISITASSQAGKLPPFKMLLSNNKVFKAQDLPMGKPIVIIYFSPDCDHCEKLMQALLKRTAELKKASIALVTFLPIDKVSKFSSDYKLAQYPNMYVGTEGNTFFLKNYYKLVSMPFMALYNKNGDLIKMYPKEDQLDDLCTRLKQLK